MLNKDRRFVLLLLIVMVLAAAGCDGGAQGSGAASAVEKYIRAKVEDKDEEKLAALSCAAWESEVGKEAASLTGVETTLTEIKCQEAGTEAEYTLVECTGLIDAVYPGGDNRQLDPGGTYHAVQEAGTWKMCGGPF